MAELGIIASGVGIAAFAIQVGDKVLKLKAFVDGIREAPEEICYLMKEIDVLCLLLSECQVDDSSNPAQQGSVAFHGSLDLCRNGVEIFTCVVGELHREILKSKRLGSFKALLKKEKLEKLRSRVRDARGLIQLSRQLNFE